MRVKKILAAAAFAAFVSALFAGPAPADVIKVSPGDSIQAAIDSAGTYDTIKLAPGTYQESVTITKDGITLKGAGSDETVIEPASSTPVCGGICVSNAADVTIKGLAVHGFPGTGVLFLGTSDQRVSGVLAEDNEDYGIAAFGTTGGQYWRNTTLATERPASTSATRRKLMLWFATTSRTTTSETGSSCGTHRTARSATTKCPTTASASCS